MKNNLKSTEKANCISSNDNGLQIEPPKKRKKYINAIIVSLNCILTPSLASFTHAAQIYQPGAGVVYQWGPTDIGGSRLGGECIMTSGRNDILGGVDDVAGEFVQTSDGIWGFEIDDDIVMLVEGTLVVSSTEYPDERGLSGVFGAMPKASNTRSRVTINSGRGWGLNPTIVSTRSISNERWQGIMSGRLYIGPNAQPGDYVTREIDAGSACGFNVFVPSGWQFSVGAPPLTCSVSAPPIIDFNKIHLTGNEKDGDILAYNNGNVSLNCSSDDQTATANTTISITGNKGRYTDTLALSGTSAPAEIQGIIGTPTPSAGSCSAKGDGYTNFINFATSTPIDVGKIKVGTNRIPYSFTLCSKGVYALGEATATATMDINWE